MGVFARRAGVVVMMGALGVMGSACFGAEAATQGAATVAGVTALMEAGKWAEALEGTKGLLNTTNGPSTTLDTTAVLKLKAECHVQLKQDVGALGTLETIRAKAVKDAAKGDQEWAEALSLLLKKKSAGFVYVPRTAEVKTPIDILDREKRKEAYRALLADEVPLYRDTVKKAAAGTSILPILDLVERLSMVRSLERAVTGGTKETTVLGKELTDVSSKLITQAEDDFSQRVGSIAASANKGKKASGPDAGEMAELAKIRADCERIIATVHKTRTFTEREDAMENAMSRGERIRERVDVVMSGKPDPVKSLPKAKKDAKE